MYGLIGRMRAKPGKRDDLLAILLKGIGSMPGCLSYVVAKDPADADAIWITEVWDTEASHKASLTLPEVRAASHADHRRLRQLDTRRAGGRRRPAALDRIFTSSRSGAVSI